MRLDTRRRSLLCDSRRPALPGTVPSEPPAPLLPSWAANAAEARPELFEPAIGLVLWAEDGPLALDVLDPDDDPGEADEPVLPATDRAPAPEPAPADPPRLGAGACTEGTDGVDTLGVRTGGGLGRWTGSGGGLGTETVGTVGVVTEGVETVGVVTVGMDTVGVDTVGVDTVGVDTVGVDTVGVDNVGTVRAGLEWGWMPTRRTATAARNPQSITLAASRHQ